MKLTEVIHFFTSSMYHVFDTVSKAVFSEDENNETLSATPVDFDILMGGKPARVSSPLSIKHTPQEKDLDFLTEQDLEEKKQPDSTGYSAQSQERDDQMQEEKSEPSIVIDMSALSLSREQPLKDTKELSRSFSVVAQSTTGAIQKELYYQQGYQLEERLLSSVKVHPPAIACDGQGNITEIYRETITTQRPPSTSTTVFGMIVTTLASFFPSPPPPPSLRGYEAIPDSEKPLSLQRPQKSLSSGSSLV